MNAKIYTCELCGKDTPKLNKNFLCDECDDNKTCINADNNLKTAKQTIHTALDKVCIMQKYNDSERVLECREEFKEAELFIVKAVNSHDKLVEALRYFVNSEHDLNDGCCEDVVYKTEYLKDAFNIAKQLIKEIGE